MIEMIVWFQNPRIVFVPLNDRIISASGSYTLRVTPFFEVNDLRGKKPNCWIARAYPRKSDFS